MRPIGRALPKNPQLDPVIQEIRELARLRHARRIDHCAADQSTGVRPARTDKPGFAGVREMDTRDGVPIDVNGSLPVVMHAVRSAPLRLKV